MNALYEGIDKTVAEKDSEIAALSAVNARMREALTAIKRHQEIVAGGAISMAVTYKIATDALAALSTPAPAGAE
jgi:hypothetical protein